MRSGTERAAAQAFWPCPDGVDGYRLDCTCICRRLSNPNSVAVCQQACLDCEGHAWPVCSEVDDRGEATGVPVCCADRKPCSRVCGDCPDCEPLPELS